MLLPIRFLLCFTCNFAYTSDDINNVTIMANELSKIETSKLWFDYLEIYMTKTLTDRWSRNVLTSYKLLFSKTHLIVNWCVISTSDANSLSADDVIHTHMHAQPCGYVKIVNGIQPSTTNFHLRTIRQLVIQVSFLLFDMDSFSEDCAHVSSVRLCLTDPTHMRCLKFMIFCGYRKPWILTTSVSLVGVSIVQLNVRYPCNLTFSYTSIENQRAYVYMKYERSDTLHFTNNPMTFGIHYTKRFRGYCRKWRLQQKLGYIMLFNNLYACCFVGSIEIYDGFESYYLIAQKKILNNSDETLDVATTYYLATLILQIHETLFMSHGDPLFILRFVKELVKVQFINSDNFSTVINNQGHLLHKVLAFNMTNGGYPNLSVAVKTFKGWNDDMCSFGGYSFIHQIETKLINLIYNQSPFCNGQAPSVPFIGTHGPEHIVFGSFQYFFTIYAFGPWFDIDIDVIIHRSFCEGLFEPMHMCAAALQSNKSKDNQEIMRYVKTSNYGIFCSAVTRTNNRNVYSLNMVNIRQCIIFQLMSLLSSDAQTYKVRAIMNVDITITIGPKHLSLYKITASRFIRLHFGTIDHVADSTLIRGSYSSYQTNVNSLNINLLEFQQRLGLYATSAFEVINHNRSCFRVQNSRSYIRKQRGIGNGKIGIVEISSYCKKFLFVNPFFYFFKSEMPEHKMRRVYYMYSYFESDCSSGSVNSLTACYEGRIYHSVVAIYKRLHLSHCIVSVTYMFHNRKNCSFIMEYRIQQIKLYVKPTMGRIGFIPEHLLVSAF